MIGIFDFSKEFMSLVCQPHYKAANDTAHRMRFFHQKIFRLRKHENGIVNILMGIGRKILIQNIDREWFQGDKPIVLNFNFRKLLYLHENSTHTINIQNHKITPFRPYSTTWDMEGQEWRERPHDN